MAVSNKKIQQERKIEHGAKELIRAILTSQAGTENLKRSLQFVLSNFKYHRYLDVNSHEVEKKLQGLYEKFEINSQTKKADALKVMVGRFLDSLAGRDPGLPKTDAHYAVLSVLISLSESPTTSAVQDAAAGEEDEVDDFDWTSYLLRDLAPLKRFSDDDSSSEDESLEADDDDMDEDLIEPSQEDTTTVAETSALCRLTGAVVEQYWERGEPSKRSNERKAGRIPHEWIASQGMLVGNPDHLHGSITEDQLMRETLWLLMSPGDGYVYSVRDGVVTHNGNLLISHLTKQSLCRSLSEFAHLGSMLYELQTFVDSSSETAGPLTVPRCATTRAFADAIKDFLQEFRSHIVEQEERCKNQENLMTMLILRDELSPWLHQVTVVHQLYRECLKAEADDACSIWVKAIICGLEQAVSREMQLLNKESARIVVTIWMKTMRPYIDFLEHWLTTGFMNNSSEEFSFHRDPDVPVQSDDYWNKSVAVADDFAEADPPLFLQPICDHLIEAGKSMELLQDMGFYVQDFVARPPGLTLYNDFRESIQKQLCGAAQPARTGPSDVTRRSILPKRSDFSDPLLDEAFKHLCELHVGERKSHDGSILGDITSLCPLEVLLHRGLHPLLLDLCSQINQRLLEVWKEEYHLSEHLSNMKKYFLLESLEDLYDFYTGLFDDLSGQEFGRDALFENLLNWKLKNVLKVRSQQDADRLFMIVESKDILAQGGLFFNSLKLKYEVPWPINLVITPAIQDKYNQIYQFLLSVKRVKYCLELINFKAGVRISQGELSPVLIHQLYLLRYKMLHFINAIHDYLMTRILHTTSHEFSDALSSVASLDTLIAVHERYLATITERCLLHPKLNLIREAVFKVLNMGVKFHRKWQLGMRTFSTSNIEAMNKEFSNCSFFLSSTLHTVTKKGNFPHLESLSVTIGANNPDIKK